MATATGVAEPEEGLSAMGDVLDIFIVEVYELLGHLHYTVLRAPSCSVE